MMNSMLVLVVLASVSCCMAQVPFLGSCPKVNVMEEFEPAKYLGKWYEAERYFTIFEIGGKCVTATYSLGENGTIVVLNQQINSVTGSKSSITGKAVADPKQLSKLTVNFPGVSFDAPYWVLDTDYDNYSVVYSCNTFGIFNTRFVWILTRHSQPELGVMQNAYKVVDKNGISKAFLMRTDQKSCPAGY